MKEQSFSLKRGLRNFTSLMAFLSALPQDKEYVVKIAEKRKERSCDQNEALWGHAYKILREHTGNDVNDLHDYFCGEYFGWIEYKVMGRRKKKPRRTTTTNDAGEREVMTTIHFADFFSFVQQRAAQEVQVYIPDPDPRWWMYKDQAAA